MKMLYVAFSKIESSNRGNQIQCKRTYEALCKANSETYGIFLGNDRRGFSKIRQDGNTFYVDMDTKSLAWIEKYFHIAILKKILYPYLFIRQSIKIIKKIQSIDLAYVRIFGLSDAEHLIKKLGKLKINRVVLELHDLDYAISIYHHLFEIVIRKFQHKKLFERLSKSYPTISLATVSKVLADSIKKDFNFHPPISVVVNVHDFRSVNQKVINYNKEKFEIIYAGLNFFKIKGIDCLIKSLYFLDSRFSIKLIGGSEKHRKSFNFKFKDLVDSHRLQIIPPMEHEKIEELLYNSDFGVIPLPSGNFSSYTSPLKMFEYMAIGLPIVASNVPAVQEVLNNGVTAIFFEPDNAEDLAKKIQYYINNPELAKEFASNARELSKKFTYERRAEVVLNCYNLS